MAILAAAEMMIPISFNPDLLSSTTTTMVTLPAARVSSISFRRRHPQPRATAAAAHVSLKASSSRCSPNRVTKYSSWDTHHPECPDPGPDYSKIRIHLERCESMEKKMYQHILREEKLYQNLFKSAHLWERSETMKKIYHYYKKAVYESGHPNKRSIVISNSALANAIVSMLQKCPFEFPMHHKAIRAPFDYYEFGLKYFRPLIDFKNSYVSNVSTFQEIEEKIRKGENVILMSDNQGKADHVFIALLLESTHPFISENMTYVMGSGVSKNPFYKIFNMGRNFINCQPKALKGSPNGVNYLLSIQDEIVSSLRSGSQLIWYSPAEFDFDAVWWMHDLANKADVPFHIYPSAILSIDGMPNPIQVERRLISFHGVGVAVNNQTIIFTRPEHFKSLQLTKARYARAIHNNIKLHEKVLKSAIIDEWGLEASNEVRSILSQPFIS